MNGLFGYISGSIRRFRGAAIIMAAAVFLSGQCFSGTVAYANGPAVTENPGADEAPAKEVSAEAVLTEEAGSEEALQNDPSEVSYVYLDAPFVTEGQITHVLIGLDESLSGMIDNAELILIEGGSPAEEGAGNDNGQKSFSASVIDGSNLLFEVSGLEAGTYGLKELRINRVPEDGSPAVSVSGNLAAYEGFSDGGSIDPAVAETEDVYVIDLAGVDGFSGAVITVSAGASAEDVLQDAQSVPPAAAETGLQNAAGESFGEVLAAESNTEDGALDSAVSSGEKTDTGAAEDSGIVISDISAMTDAGLENQADLVAGALIEQGAVPSDRSEEIINAEEAKRSNKRVVVFLDPGHDNTHAGARANGLLEENMTLTVANYCKKYLEEHFTNVTVYMSRTSGNCPYPGTSSGDDNAARVAAAASVGANAYVSIHFNTTAAASGSSKGAMVFYPNSNYNADCGAAGRNLSSAILTELVKLGLANNGIKTLSSRVGDTYPDGSLADYYGVIRRSKLYGFPGIIIEHAFLNNASDAAFLSSDENLKKLGEADAIGISKAFALSTEPLVEEDGTIVHEDDYSLSCKLNAKEKKCVLTLDGVDEDAEGVKFNVYSTEYDMDDLTEYEAEEGDEDGEWNATIKIKDHASSGEYMVFAYIVDDTGKSEKVATGSFTVTGPSVGEVKVTSVNKSAGRMHITAADIEAPSGISGVRFRITNLSGTKKTEEVKAKKKKSGKYQADSNLKLHGNASGKYRIEVIVKDKTDIEYVRRVTYKMGSGQNTKIEDTGFKASLSSNQKKLTLTSTKLDAFGSITGVRYKITSIEGGISKYYNTKKKKAGKYTMKVSIGDFGYAGEYRITGYAKQKNGEYILIGPSQTVKVSGVTAGALSYASAGPTSTLMTISTGGSTAEVKSVSVKAWPKVKKSAIHTYKAQESEGVYKCTVDASNHKDKTGTYVYEVTVKLNSGLTKKLLKGVFEIGKDPVMYSIAGANEVTLNQLVAYYQDHAAYPSFYASSDASTLRKFCKLYIDECQAEGIRAEVAFCQAMKETNFLRYGGDVGIEQYNFAGLGATGGGAKGKSFDSVKQGIRAQIQHLKAYANSEELVNPCVDDRFTYVSRGSAQYVQWLGIPDNPEGKGWATDTNYGGSILMMISELKSY